MNENTLLYVQRTRGGGGVVILDKLAYHSEMSKILSDTGTYVKLPTNPTLEFKRSLIDLIDLIETGAQLGILDKKERSYLIPAVSRIPVIYYSSKVNKDIHCPPGRPIISGINSVTSRVGKYIDFHLQPIVKSIPSYLKDTRHTISLLQKISYSRDILFVTADVAWLYNCISHNLGFLAVKSFLARVNDIPNTKKKKKVHYGPITVCHPT